MDQNNGGILGKINTPTTSVASGVWSLDSQFEAQSSSIWPLAFPQTTIANSCRFNNASTDYLNQTASGTSTLNTKATFSTWVKRSTSNDSKGGLFSGYIDVNDRLYITVNSDTLFVFGKIGGTTKYNLQVSRNFRDLSAWYHFVIAIDTTQSTASNRVKAYINGEQATVAATTSPDKDSAIPFAPTNSYNILAGRIYATQLEQSLDGYLTEHIFVDGQALDQTSFGAFNPVTNIWEPIAYAGTYGNNGFRLDFADSSALGNDVSGNNNDFTVNNLTSIDQSTDTCSNNFCTLNPLYRVPTFSYSEGNLKGAASSSGKGTARGTMGIQDSGKWYFEVKITTDDACGVGISNEDMDANTWQPTSGTFVIYHNNGTKVVNGTASSYGATYGDGDIIGVAYNADDAEITFYKNGASQSTITGVTTGKFMLPSISDTGTSSDATLECNFGSPSFSISSGNADANGHGNFEYSVPSGYFALCTKNLAENG